MVLSNVHMGWVFTSKTIQTIDISLLYITLYSNIIIMPVKKIVIAMCYSYY
jgi:hypothetical protein